jgi:hypothetical protein
MRGTFNTSAEHVMMFCVEFGVNSYKNSGLKFFFLSRWNPVVICKQKKGIHCLIFV